MYRYHDIESRGLRDDGSFGIARVEDYDPDLHDDATYSYGDIMHNGGMCQSNRRKNDKIVAKDDYEGRDIVFERWLPLLESDYTPKLPGAPVTVEAWQEFWVPVNNQRISVQVYWTKNTNLHEHAPIRRGRNAKSPLKSGIYNWGDELVKTLPDLGAMGFISIASKEGPVFKVYCRLLLECNGANISVRWQLARPGTPPYDGTDDLVSSPIDEYMLIFVTEQGQRREGNIDYEDDDVFELCDSAYNPFPRASPS